jgi:hypothetical protein
LFAGALAALASIGALNGGATLTASSWDSIVTYINGMLTSTWVLVLAFVVLIITVWQLAHGGGYKTIGLILGVLGVALIGPGVVRGVATSVGDAASIEQTPSGFVHKLK